MTPYDKDQLADDVLACRKAAAAWFNNVALQAMERVILCAEKGLADKIVRRDTVKYPLIEGELPSPGGYHRGVSLTSMAHPIGNPVPDDKDLDTNSIETIESYPGFHEEDEI